MLFALALAVAALLEMECAMTHCAAQTDGWCGKTSAHCSGSSGGGGTATEVPTCGGCLVGNGMCADGSCCSQYGWCGTTSAHCSGSTGRGDTTFAIILPVQSLSVADIQTGLDRYNQLQGGIDLPTKDLSMTSILLLKDTAVIDSLPLLLKPFGNLVATNSLKRWLGPLPHFQRVMLIKTVTAGICPAFSSLPTGSTFMGEFTCSCLGVPTTGHMEVPGTLTATQTLFFNNPELVPTIYAMDSTACFF
jgi:hypothetical protein